jgi:hypothetical protein
MEFYESMAFEIINVSKYILSCLLENRICSCTTVAFGIALNLYYRMNQYPLSIDNCYAVCRFNFSYKYCRLNKMYIYFFGFVLWPFILPVTYSLKPDMSLVKETERRFKHEKPKIGHVYLHCCTKTKALVFNYILVLFR